MVHILVLICGMNYMAQGMKQTQSHFLLIDFSWSIPLGKKSRDGPILLQ